MYTLCDCLSDNDENSYDGSESESSESVDETGDMGETNGDDDACKDDIAENYTADDDAADDNDAEENVAAAQQEQEDLKSFLKKLKNTRRLASRLVCVQSCSNI